MEDTEFYLPPQLETLPTDELVLKLNSAFLSSDFERVAAELSHREQLLKTELESLQSSYAQLVLEKKSVQADLYKCSTKCTSLEVEVRMLKEELKMKQFGVNLNQGGVKFENICVISDSDEAMSNTNWTDLLNEKEKSVKMETSESDSDREDRIPLSQKFGKSPNKACNFDKLKELTVPCLESTGPGFGGLDNPINSSKDKGFSENGFHKRKALGDWESEGDMLCSIMNNPELCMESVCVMYRYEKSLIKMGKIARPANTGFNAKDLHKAMEMAEFLNSGDPIGPVKRTVEQLKSYNPGGLDYCRKIATNYCKQLFDIYKKRTEPYFC